MNADAFSARSRRIRIILSDVDGVLTNGTVLLTADGRESKSFHVRDGVGVSLAHSVGLRTGLFSGRRSEVVVRRAAELGMSVVRLGVTDKLNALKDVMAKEGLTLDQVAFMGDDLLDIPVMAVVALSAAPMDAPEEVRAHAHFIAATKGGQGCMREFVEAILRARGDWERAIASLGVTSR
jgi:3-deoxy-D-manno-octulosonate 8-phosphate phosphatase (KDO 8-P phosphatase)